MIHLRKASSKSRRKSRSSGMVQVWVGCYVCTTIDDLGIMGNTSRDSGMESGNNFDVPLVSNWKEVQKLDLYAYIHLER